MTTRLTLRRINPWRVAMVAVVAVMGLAITATPAHADHFYVTSQSYLDPWPADAGGRDAAIGITRSGNFSLRVYAEFQAAGERVTVTNRAGGWARWRLVVPGVVDPNGYLPSDSCVMWGASRWRAEARGCAYWGNWDIPEGTGVRLILCLQTWHGEVCPTYAQQARGRA